MLRAIVYLSLAVLLVGCAAPSPYQPDAFAGGYTDSQLDQNIFRVTFRGNGFAKPERAQDLALLRSAELALKHGFTHFAIIDERGRTDTAVVTSPTQSFTSGTATMSGNTITGTATTTTTGGIPFVIRKPSTTNVIYCFRGKPEGTGLLYDAQFVWDSLSKQYGIPTAPRP